RSSERRFVPNRSSSRSHDITAARSLGASRGKTEERGNLEKIRSKRVANYHIQDDHKSSNYTGNQSQPPLNEMTDGLTEPLEGPSQNEEPSAAGNQARSDKQPNMKANNAEKNRTTFIRGKITNPEG